MSEHLFKWDLDIKKEQLEWNLALSDYDEG